MDTIQIQAAVKLAGEIVGDHFGPVAQKVCTELLTKGELTLSQINNYLQIGQENVKMALLVLIQHNCVRYHEEEKDPSPSLLSQQKEKGVPPKKIKFTFYVALIDHILTRLRFPRLSLIAKERYGNEGEILYEELMHHGRLTTDSVVKQAALLAAKIRGTQAGERDIERFNKVFQKMVHENFVIDAAIEDPTESKKSSNLNPNFSAASEDNTSNKVSTNSQVFWRINHNRCNIHFRNETCIELVREKFDKVAASVIRCAFRIVESSLKLRQEESNPFYVDQLVEVFSRSNSNDVEKQILQSLDTLCNGSLRVINKVSGEGKTASYVINIGKLVETSKQRIVDSIITEKFGGLSARIFKLLQIKKQLEQKQISSLGMIPLKETRERLYSMLTANYVYIQEVPRSNDHAVPRNIYLWYVRLEPLLNLLCNDMYKGIRNLRMRLQFHLTEAKDVISKAEEIQSRNHSETMLTEGEKITLEKMQRVGEQIEDAIIHLDDTIQLLRF